MLNVAIVALGRWGQRLVDSVQRDGVPLGDQIRFTHAVVRTKAKVAEYAARQKLVLTTSLDEMLADRSIDAVVIATPHSQHAAQIVACAAAGKPIFVEKPFTLSTEAAQTAVGACRQMGVVLALGHNRRFLPAMQLLKTMVDDGTLGTILHVEGNFSGAFGFDYKPGMWRVSDEEAPAGGLTAMGIHTIDSFLHLAGPIARVRARSQRRVLTALDDTTDATLDFASGATGYLTTMTATPRMWRIQIFGTKGWAHMRDHHLLDVCGLDLKIAQHNFPAVDIERAELEAFAAAISGGKPYPITPEEMIHGVAVMEAMVAAITSGDVHLVAAEIKTGAAAPV